MLNRKETEPDRPDVPEETGTEKTDVSQEDLLVGTEFVLDGRNFRIDSIDTETGKASLKDMDFLKGAGFPIFRTEPVSFVRELVREQKEKTDEPREENQTAEVIPLWERAPQKKKRPATASLP